jgi:hypothetical protein
MLRSSIRGIGWALAVGLATACTPASAHPARANTDVAREERAGCGDSTHVRRLVGESASAFVTRVHPDGKELVHPVLEGNFGITPRDILALYGSSGAGLRDGWVLTPAPGCAGWYRRHLLPIEDVSQIEVAAPSYRVRSAFRANADRDAARELLLILYAEGPGPADEYGNRQRKHEHNVAVFDWTGTRFVYRYPVSRRLYGLRTAEAVRRRLRALGYSRGDEAEATPASTSTPP